MFELERRADRECDKSERNRRYYADNVERFRRYEVEYVRTYQKARNEVARNVRQSDKFHYAREQKTASHCDRKNEKGIHIIFLPPELRDK